MTDSVLLLNPKSAGGRHTDRTQRLAATAGFEVRESTARGETYDLARAAAGEGIATIAAGGGDGTLNEVVAGIDDAGALAETTVGVVPAGTGNNFAARVGIRGLEHAFDVLDTGRRRRIDLGDANGRRFVNSCVGGLTADASVSTTPELKRRWGALAYVIATLREYRTFEGIDVEIRDDEGADVWTGSAIGILVGNGRRFVGEPGTQANMEDGLLNVVLIESKPAYSLATEEAVSRFLRRDADHLTRVLAPRLHLSVHGDEPAGFSLDGERLATDELTVESRPRCLELPVGERYRPEP
ncbi:diacylglycerol/lipid kinase family protein [Haloarchaeobius litoreus]|uniref:Diacylglycerol/lipid kinase family protein n=1 Tax=Haloarchaeobius litoreus TaxID=755306 RepID=A0ABD6DQ51_9EURY|nr:YegS/Rv2252/BmrU family lipid kinase [Haloarchaeobius litoreus]